MSLTELLNYRRAVRHFDETQSIDPSRVEACVKLATLAPTSSNMQLWEAYHVTDSALKGQLAHACLDQLAAQSADQFVVFVTRQDRYKAHAKAILTHEMEHIKRTAPAEKQEMRIQKMTQYYAKLMPFLYSRGCRVWGMVRKLLAFCIGLRRPILRDVSETDMRVTVHQSCSLAIQTFLLAMAEAEYDTCPLGGFDNKLVKKALKLPRGSQVCMVIACGKRAEDGVWGERFRLPFETFYHQV